MCPKYFFIHPRSTYDPTIQAYLVVAKNPSCRRVHLVGVKRGWMENRGRKMDPEWYFSLFSLSENRKEIKWISVFFTWPTKISLFKLKRKMRKKNASQFKMSNLPLLSAFSSSWNIIFIYLFYFLFSCLFISFFLFKINLSQLFQKTDQAGRIRHQSLWICQALLAGVEDTSGEWYWHRGNNLNESFSNLIFLRKNIKCYNFYIVFFHLVFFYCF